MRRGVGTLHSVSCVCVQGNYHSWHPRELKFTVHDLQSLRTYSAKPQFQQIERERIGGRIHFTAGGKKSCAALCPQLNRRTRLEKTRGTLDNAEDTKPIILLSATIIQHWEEDKC